MPQGACFVCLLYPCRFCVAEVARRWHKSFAARCPWPTTTTCRHTSGRTSPPPCCRLTFHLTSFVRDVYLRRIFCGCSSDRKCRLLTRQHSLLQPFSLFRFAQALRSSARRFQPAFSHLRTLLECVPPLALPCLYCSQDAQRRQRVKVYLTYIGGGQYPHDCALLISDERGFSRHRCI